MNRTSRLGRLSRLPRSARSSRTGSTESASPARRTSLARRLTPHRPRFLHMSRFPLFQGPERAGTARRPGWVSLVGLILVPFVIAGILTWALWNPEKRLDTIQGAIVNLDQPVTVDGELLPLGRELAGGLVGTAKPGSSAAQGNYSWTITSASDAAAGLKSGKYAVVITIPKDFSQKASSLAGPASDATKATLQVQTSPQSKILDSTLSSTIAATAADKLGNQVSESYLDNIYLGFNNLGTKLSDASSSAQALSESGSTLSQAATASASGTQSLASAALSIAGVASQYASAVSTYTRGVTALTSGLSSYLSGVQQYTSGVQTLGAGVQQAAASAGTLVTGGAAVRSGASTLASSLSQFSSGVSSLPSTSSQVATGVGQMNTTLQQLATPASDQTTSVLAACQAGDAPSCQSVAAAVQQLVGQSPTLAQAATGVAQLAATAASGISSEANNAAAVSQAANSFTQGVGTFASSIQSMSAGVGTLNSTSGTIASGGQQLSAAASLLGSSSGTQLASGANAMSTGLQAIAQSATTLDTGIQQLATGLGTYVNGTTQLSTGVSQAASSVPSYSSDERKSLSTLVTAPVATSGATTGTGLGGTLATAMAILALWLGALASFMVLRPFSTRALSSSRSSAILALRGLIIPAIVAVLQGAAVAGALEPLLRLSMWPWFELLGVSALAAVTFAAVNQALVAIFGGVGRFMSMLVILLGLATSVVSTAPAVLATIVDWTPLGPAQSLARVVVIGPDAGNWVASIINLGFWLIGSLLVTTLVAARSRTVSPALLRYAT